MTILVKKEILNCTSPSQQKEVDLLLLARHREKLISQGPIGQQVLLIKTKNINDEEGA